MNIAVPKSDIEQIGATSIPIPDTNDMYFAGLSVFHELHCIVSPACVDLDVPISLIWALASETPEAIHLER